MIWRLLCLVSVIIAFAIPTKSNYTRLLLWADKEWPLTAKDRGEKIDIGMVWMAVLVTLMQSAALYVVVILVFWVVTGS